MGANSNLRAITRKKKEEEYLIHVSNGIRTKSCNNKMHLTTPAFYAVRLSLNIFQEASPTLYSRASKLDRSTTTYAIFLATFGLSMSMFSLNQMKLSYQRRHLRS